MTLLVERANDDDCVRFRLSGRIEGHHIAELQAMFDAEHRPIVIDMAEVRLVDLDVVTFLARCEAEGTKLDNPPAYIRAWMARTFSS